MLNNVFFPTAVYFPTNIEQKQLMQDKWWALNSCKLIKMLRLQDVILGRCFGR